MTESIAGERVTGTHLADGWVTAAESGHFMVESSWGCRLCIRAAGCLVEPGVGDLVLLAVGEEKCYILTLLERADETLPFVVTLHEGAAIEAAPGRIALQARREVTLQAQGRVGITGERFDLTAREGRMVVRNLTMIGDRLESVWQECRETVSSMQTVCLKWVQNLGDSLRRVKNLDETHASHVRTLAAETIHTQGKFVNHTASEIVRVEVREVHLG
jgi:hypothetical protein